MPTLLIENIPPKLHTALQKMAQYNHCSITQQALNFLEQGLHEKTPPKFDVTDFKESKATREKALFTQNFKDRLKTTRKKASLTQTELAEKADIELSNLEKLEKGEIYPFKAVGAVSKLARALEVTSFWLVYGDLPMTDDPERIALVDSIQGKYAFVNTSSEQFAERKRQEYEQDN